MIIKATFNTFASDKIAVMSLIQENVPIGGFTTLGFSVQAARYATFDSVESLRQILSVDKGPFFILGGGSNICFTGDIEATVLHNRILGISVLEEEDNSVMVEAGAGENWHHLVEWSLANNFGGLENLSLIPGTVGAAPMQNIGAYGVELNDVFTSLDALDLSTQEVRTFNREDCRFGYRESVFKQELKDKCIILNVKLRLKKPPHTLHLEYGAIRQILERNRIHSPTIQDVSRAVIEIRQSKLPDPAVIGNAGSFFKNPVIDPEHLDRLLKANPDMVYFPQSDGKVKIPAGWLIEKCGWKGYRDGQVGCHKDQALVLVHYGGGKGEDLVRLANAIQQNVKDTFDIVLQTEVNIL
jgi:UDP-N-acetylmuramate dehydrogenase